MKKSLNYLLALLGISACNSCCMYGCPNADWHVSGQVVNEKGEPIKGIQVTDGWNQAIDTTDVNGAFDASRNDISCVPAETLYFNDIDGSENGLYQSASLENIELTQVRKGDKNWYSGAFEAVDLKVVMKEDKPE